MAGPKRSRHSRSKSCVVSFTLQAEVEGGAELVLRDGMGSASPIAGVRVDSVLDKQENAFFVDLRACMTSDEGTLPALIFPEEGGEQERRHGVPYASKEGEVERGSDGRFRFPRKAAWSRQQQQLVTRWKNWVASLKVRNAKGID